MTTPRKLTFPKWNPYNPSRDGMKQVESILTTLGTFPSFPKGCCTLSISEFLVSVLLRLVVLSSISKKTCSELNQMSYEYETVYVNPILGDQISAIDLNIQRLIQYMWTHLPLSRVAILLVLTETHKMSTALKCVEQHKLAFKEKSNKSQRAMRVRICVLKNAYEAHLDRNRPPSSETIDGKCTPIVNQSHPAFKEACDIFSREMGWEPAEPLSQEVRDCFSRMTEFITDFDDMVSNAHHVQRVLDGRDHYTQKTQLGW